jgi:hypothetical protein
VNLSPHDWNTIGTFACMAGAVIAAGLGNLGRDEKMKWQVTTEKNRIAGFFFALFVVATGALSFFGPKGS